MRESSLKQSVIECVSDEDDYGKDDRWLMVDEDDIDTDVMG